MPNHVINEIIFEADRETQVKILALACGNDGKVDFNILVPMPKNIWQGNVGSNHAVFKSNGLDWSKQNWGTKWNAYGSRPIQQTDGRLTMIFETAWSPPYPWMAALFNTMELPFVHNWLDEGASRGRHGRFWVADYGNEWEEVDADDDLHRHLHKLHWGVEEFEEEEA